MSSEGSPPESPPETIRFDFIKSNYFRVIHMDGALGGVNPNGTIQMALYSERAAIPKTVEYELNDGALGPALKREGREAVVREIEVDAILSLDVAKALRAWLDNKIQTLETLATAREGKE